MPDNFGQTYPVDNPYNPYNPYITREDPPVMPFGGFAGQHFFHHHMHHHMHHHFFHHHFFPTPFGFGGPPFGG